MPSGPPIVNLASLTPNAFSSSVGGSFGHHRRRSSASNVPAGFNFQDPSHNFTHTSTSGASQTLETIPGTPNLPMSLSRSPSPRPGGGWASPGLSSPFANVSGRSSPANTHRGSNGANSVTWESAKAKMEGVNGYPSFSTQNNGFFNRHYRSFSNSLPSFNMGPEKSYAEKEKLGRGRWMARGGGKIARLRSIVRNVSRKMKIRFFIVTAFIVMIILFYTTRKITCGHFEIMLTRSSSTLLLAESQISRGWKEIRDHSGCKPRRRRDGVERPSRMGHRAGQCTK